MSRELKGQTGWTVTGDAGNQTLTFQLAMIVEQYGVTVTDVLPDDIGVFWALPTSDSTPANPKWDVEKLFHPSSKSFAVQ